MIHFHFVTKAGVYRHSDALRENRRRRRQNWRQAQPVFDEKGEWQEEKRF